MSEAVGATGVFLAPLRGRLDKLSTSRPWLVRSVIYLALFTAATFVFIFLRFPEERLLPIVNNAMQKAPVKMEAQGASLAFPLGVRLTGLEVWPNMGSGAPALDLPRVTIAPSLLALLSGGIKASVEAQILGGRAEANVESVGDGGSLELEFHEVDPGKGNWWSAFPWFRVAGLMEGEAELAMKAKDIMTGQGKLSVRMKDASLTLGKSLNPDGTSLAITEGELEVNMARGVATVAKGNFEGPHINMQVAGGITLAAEPSDSRLNVTITLRLTEEGKKALGTAAFFLPQPGAGGNIMIRIGGTLREPMML